MRTNVRSNVPKQSNSKSQINPAKINFSAKMTPKSKNENRLFASYFWSLGK